jgi:glycosyltransferase involved in cell wall biosynthesis
MGHPREPHMIRPLVSIMMPAYDRPEYTRRALQSVVEQEYRPIEVVLSDNCSPVSLERIVDEFRAWEDECFSIRFYRQQSNIGFPDNEIFVFDRLSGKYALFLSNDDCFTDTRFLQEAVEIMERNPECYLCGANSEIEKTNGKRMINLPSSIDAKDKWSILPGDAYMKLLGEDGIGYHAYSAVVFKLGVARSLGAMHYPFNIPGNLESELDILGDEGGAVWYLLASAGSVALSEKVVSVRGMPEESYSRSERWQALCNQAMFIIFYNLHSAKLSGKHARAVKKRARETIFVYALDSINVKIMRHYRYRIEVVWLMLTCWALYYARYYGRMFKRIKRVLVNNDANQVQEIVAKVKERGLLRSVLPFLTRPR